MKNLLKEKNMSHDKITSYKYYLYIYIYIYNIYYKKQKLIKNMNE